MGFGDNYERMSFTIPQSEGDDILPIPGIRMNPSLYFIIVFPSVYIDNNGSVTKYEY